MSLGFRYVHKGWDQTIDDIGVCAPGSQTCGEVYNIANQDLAALQEYAGQTVSLTGDVKGESIAVSKVAAGGKKQ